jgi:dephospho-CoA kinase
MGNKVIAIVGMCGSGKSEVSKILSDLGLIKIRFGDITDKFLMEKKLPRTAENERKIREGLRKKYGMAAYAVLNIKNIKRALKSNDVILDGLYSWEEYLYLKRIFNKQLITVLVHASPETRYLRLMKRKERPLTLRESRIRDRTEIENINKGGPIAMAEFVILNENKSLKTLSEEVISLWKKIKKL